jgi:hypothetical protein
MAEPRAARQVAALWSLSHGFAELLMAGQFGPPDRALAHAEAMLPDMVRGLFGVPTMDRAEDLATIAAVATGAR